MLGRVLLLSPSFVTIRILLWMDRPNDGLYLFFCALKYTRPLDFINWCVLVNVVARPMSFLVVVRQSVGMDHRLDLFFSSFQYVWSLDVFPFHIKEAKTLATYEKLIYHIQISLDFSHL
ncbi:hypothetical protein EUGRSUZ_J02846 [Eucalyptus grandis]|uniref:Uncharacterized protein n=2 Tax=Eucalyptus grandis TaxID=71139 RepID=A0ACC3J9S7_EUCGR|nr:hypothetical protein EUGRSUZ_J02846 [Eucalyptus grandis]